MEVGLFWQAVLLGLVEGITEFLPVSSTGHLILVSTWLQFDAVPGKLFEIVVQGGAILAICVRYRRKLLDVALHLFTRSEARRFATNLLIAFLPAALIGVLVHDFMKAHLFNNIVVAAALIIGGIAILVIERMVKAPRIHTVEEFSPRLALLVGAVQCIALIPGVSRSGATIMGALLAGADRKAAAEFSFFLAIPTLLGATVYDLYKNWNLLQADSLPVIGVGFAVAFLSAWLVVEWMIGFVSRRGFGVFAWYRIALGLVVLLAASL